MKYKLYIDKKLGERKQHLIQTRSLTLTCFSTVVASDVSCSINCCCWCIVTSITAHNSGVCTCWMQFFKLSTLDTVTLCFFYQQHSHSDNNTGIQYYSQSEFVTLRSAVQCCYNVSFVLTIQRMYDNIQCMMPVSLNNSHALPTHTQATQVMVAGGDFMRRLVAS